MRWTWLLASIAVLAGSVSGPAHAGDERCRPRALAQLRASAPDGWSIYRQMSDPAFFASWIDCGASQYDLSTAVHESTHAVTAETDSFPLVGGGAVARPHEVSAFFPPSRIAGAFGDDDFTSIYLRPGRASSSNDFLYLLDEFDAYTHDLSAAVDLEALSSADETVDHRDGLAAMMAFVAVYARTARESEPAAWNGLRQPRVAGTIAALWGRAERVMARSCGIPNFGTLDRSYLARVCDADAGSAIAQVIGRPPICPAACLTPVADATHDEQQPIGEIAGTPPEELDDMPTASVVRGRHPFAATAGPRHHRQRDQPE